MSDKVEEHTPLRRQQDWQTAHPDEEAISAPRLGATISAHFDSDEARLIRQAAKRANQTQSAFVHEAALAAARAQSTAATVAVVTDSESESDVASVQKRSA
jgi:uncharacterized protein (DUF1778 family)